MKSCACFYLVRCLPPSPGPKPRPPGSQKSNQNAQLLIEILARYSPEEAAAKGVGAWTTRSAPLLPISPSASARTSPWLASNMKSARRGKGSAGAPGSRDPDGAKSIAICARRKRNERNLLPYDRCGRRHFLRRQGPAWTIRSPADRRPAALVRLRKYAGLEPGFTARHQAEERFREKLNTPGLLGPLKAKWKRISKTPKPISLGSACSSKSTRCKATRTPSRS